MLATIAGDRYGAFTTDCPKWIVSVEAAIAPAMATDSHTPSEVSSPL